MPPIPAATDWLRADLRTAADPSVRVDRANGIIYGHVLAEKGPFKSKARGEFDDLSLDRIVDLAAQHANGLKSRFTHPSLSADGLGKFLGRDRNVRRDGDKVRADLHLDRTALDTPPSGGKPLGQYVMDLAQSDPEAFGASLVLKADKEYRLADDGKSRLTNDAGELLPPLWRPKALHAADVVDEGDAVHNGFLSADTDHLPDAVVRRASELLDEQFPNADRATVRTRCLAWLDRYSEMRFGPDDRPEDDSMSMTDPQDPATPKPPAPKPPPPPDPATPPPAPKPKPATAELSGATEAQLAALVDRMVSEKLGKAKADLDAAAAAMQAEHSSYRQEREAEALAAAHRRIDAQVDAAISDGYLAPSQREATVEFLRTQDHVAARKTVQVNGQERKLTQLDLALERLTAGVPQSFAQRIPSGGDHDTLSPERRRELLDYSLTGRAILKDEMAGTNGR